jgi:hypothetical protein
LKVKRRSPGVVPGGELALRTEATLWGRTGRARQRWSGWAVLRTRNATHPEAKALPLLSSPPSRDLESPTVRGMFTFAQKNRLLNQSWPGRIPFMGRSQDVVCAVATDAASDKQSICDFSITASV